MLYFVRNRTSLVNKDQHILHKLSLDAHTMAVSYWQVQEYEYTNILNISFVERILLHFLLDPLERIPPSLLF